jgi:hypothetical protein
MISGFDIALLDRENAEFNFAAEFVMQTTRLVYLTGKAGTGKTTFLKYLQATCSKKMVILAPTGVAAVNAGGQTIHSFLNIKPSVYVPGDKRLRFNTPATDPDQTIITDHFRYQREKLELIRNLELLIIDEISMVRCDLLDVIDQLLRHIRRRHFTPFGGLQVLLIGDTFQLPPIANYDDWSVLSRFYESPYFFSAQVFKAAKPLYIELKKIYRQKDETFIELLNRIRLNKLHFDDLRILNSRYLHGFDPEKVEDYIILASHNRMVIETNRKRLDEINEDSEIYNAVIEGVFPENSYPADQVLELKKGAQVMMLRNDRNKKYFNGKIGHVIELTADSMKVEFPDDSVVEVSRETWDNIRYKWDVEQKKVVEESIGTFMQFPVKLAWAITVHKSQGLTFDKVIADVGESFAHGQVYVAFSRCTSFSGLLLKSPMNAKAIKTDPVVLEFASNETPETVLLKELEKSKGHYYLKVAVKAWLSKEVTLATESFFLYLEEKDSDFNKAIKLCEFGIEKYILNTTTLLRKALNGINEEDVQPENDQIKYNPRKIKTKLKSSLSIGQALSTFLDDLSEYERAQDIVARYSTTVDALVDGIKKTRKAIKPVSHTT